MKKLIVLSLLVASQSFAGVLPQEEAALVVQAAVEASQVSKLKCDFMNAKGEVLKTTPIAEAFVWSAFALSDEVQTQVSVNEDETKPMITIKRKIPNATFVEETNIETNAAMTEVVNFNYKTFTVTATNRNVGTIMKPKYEVVRTLALETETNCQ